MNYLKSITTTVLQSTGVTFPFSIGERIPGLDGQTIWDIREGIKRDDQTPLTLFIFDSTLPPLQPGHRDRKAVFALAKNALRKLRTIRHPHVLKYIDSVETDTHVYIATERVRPLNEVLRDWDTGTYVAKGGGKGKEKAKEEWIAWGVKSLGTAIGFLNAPPLSVHHALLLPSSIFVTSALEWRLGGFDVLSTKEDGTGVLWTAVGGFGGLQGGDLGQGGVVDRSGPEVRRGGWAVLREADPALSDTYQLALLLFSIYNPNLPLPNLSTSPQPSSVGALPRSLFPIYKRMINPNVRTRLPTTSFVDEVAASGFWSGNPLIQLVDGLENFELASEGEKQTLLRTIKESIDTLPFPFLTYRILPSLLHSLSLPTAPSSAILPLVLKIGNSVPPQRWGQVVLEPVIRLWASPDRGTRMALLEGLSMEGGYGDKLDKATVTEKVWPHLITGFADTVAVIREATVKAVPLLAPKLSDRILNNDLLRVLAKMQVDPEPSIRTNTCILLGRLAPLLGPNTKKRVLVPAFARSLKDSFVHARVAGLMAFMATVEFFDKDDLAGKVIPNMAFTMVDKEKLVRDQAFKAMALFMGRIEAATAQMPDTVLQDASNIGPVTSSSPQTSSGQASMVSSAAGAAGALAGWAIASIGKQLPISELHTTMSASAASAATLQPPSIPGGISTSQATSPRSSISDTKRPARPAAVSSFGAAATPSRLGRSGGMQLGGGVSSSSANRAADSSSLVDALAGEFEEDGDEVANAWGQGDLMDVNADADDWSAFETAPTPMEVHLPARTATPAKASNGHANAATSSSQHKFGSRAADSTPVFHPPAPTPSRAPPPKPAAVVHAPIADGWDDSDVAFVSGPTSSAGGEEHKSTTVSLAGLSKEEKEKEMARRREERKARIAAMKEQKKTKA